MYTDPTYGLYFKEMLRRLHDLMQANLTDAQRQLIFLHCGLQPSGKSMRFSHLADLFHLPSAQAAQRAYCDAVIKTRAAIPGSLLEAWILHHQNLYRLSGLSFFYADPRAPVPHWDTAENE